MEGLGAAKDGLRWRNCGSVSQGAGEVITPTSFSPYSLVCWQNLLLAESSLNTEDKVASLIQATEVSFSSSDQVKEDGNRIWRVHEEKPAHMFTDMYEP